MAEGYTPLGLGDAEPAIPEGEGWIGAAGGIWSTPSDLLRWDLALMDGKVLSPAGFATMSTPRRLSDGRSSGYGCGQSIEPRHGTQRGQRRGQRRSAPTSAAASARPAIGRTATLATGRTINAVRYASGTHGR